MCTEISPLPKVAEIVELFCRSFSYVDTEKEASFAKNLQRLSHSAAMDDVEIQNLIKLRLSFLSKNDPKFTSVLKSEFLGFLNLYREFVIGVDCAGFSREQFIVSIQERFFLPQAAYSIRKVIGLAEGPNIAEWGQDVGAATALVLHWWLDKNSLSKPSFARELYGYGKFGIEQKSIEDNLYSWSMGKVLNIRSILSFYDGKNQVLARWLLIAKVWEIFWQGVPKDHQNHFSKVWKAHLLSKPAKLDFFAFQEAIWERGRLDPRHSEFLRLFKTKYAEVDALVSIHNDKKAGDDARASKLLSELQDENPIPELTWMIDHLRARYYVQLGELKQALETYSLALEGAQYRHGPMTKEILGELLIVAAYQGNKRIAKKWEGCAKAFGLEVKIRNPTDAYFQRFPISSSYQEANKGTAQEQYNKRIVHTVISADVWLKRPLDLNRPDRWVSGFGSIKKTQLMIFSGLGQTGKVRKLLQKKANPNLVAEDGNTALMRAVLHDQKACFDTLLPLTDPKLLSSIYKPTGISALSDAIDQGKLYYLDKLLGAGVDIELKVSFMPKRTPLYIAVQNCATLDDNSFDLQSDDTLEATIKFLPAPLVPAGIPFAQDQYEAMRRTHKNSMQNPRHKKIYDAVKDYYATGQGVDIATRLEVVKKLLNYQADPNAQHENGFTPLLLAAELGLWDVFDLMLLHGGDSSSMTDANQTVLHLALWKGHFEFSLNLLRNVSEQERETLISQPAAHGNPPIYWFMQNSAQDGNAVENELSAMLHDI